MFSFLTSTNGDVPIKGETVQMSKSGLAAMVFILEDIRKRRGDRE
jgi:hypothetical protein